MATIANVVNTATSPAASRNASIMRSRILRYRSSLLLARIAEEAVEFKRNTVSREIPSATFAASSSVEWSRSFRRSATTQKRQEGLDQNRRCPSSDLKLCFPRQQRIDRH